MEFRTEEAGLAGRLMIELGLRQGRAVMHQRRARIFIIPLFVIAAASILSFISLYVYELPTHHCPFCILQREYGYVGYALYATLLTGTVSGVGVGVLMPFRKTASLAAVIPSIQKRLAMLLLISYATFTAIALYRMLISNLVP